MEIVTVEKKNYFIDTLYLLHTHITPPQKTTPAPPFHESLSTRILIKVLETLRIIELYQEEDVLLNQGSPRKYFMTNKRDYAHTLHLFCLVLFWE